MAAAGTVVLEAKIAVPFGGWQILCRLNHDDGWDHRACMDRRAIRTETKARECVEWQYSMPC